MPTTGDASKRATRPSGYGDTYEIYGLQEDGVTRWVLGDARFDGEVVDVTVETVGPPVSPPAQLVERVTTRIIKWPEYNRRE